MGFNAFYFISRMQGRVNICICRGEHFAFFMFINEAPGGKQTKAFITQQLNQKQLQPSGVSRNNQNLSSNTHQSSLSLLDQNYNSLCFGQPAGQFYQQQQIQHVTLLKKKKKSQYKQNDTHPNPPKKNKKPNDNHPHDLSVFTDCLGAKASARSDPHLSASQVMVRRLVRGGVEGWKRPGGG